ncbi:nitroreductase [Chlorobium phaeovibrioides]|uniref:Nitroreductase n=1 Tax=Chlorobium phaeovibrioides TaxID=1094 RepID=A0A5M8IBT4_CHLPH|nr:nitroreductase family protein [Chlorobium phaeovibrioides]KAA6231809.1 nitroreductase [Chlorobium phaeovibrioides]
MKSKQTKAMSFLQLAAERCSTRSFRTDPIPDEVIGRILEAGRLAPSAKNLQPWHFTLVQTPAMLEKVHACYSRNWFHTAPAILIVSGRYENAWVRPADSYNSLETDLAITLDHMILAAAEEGVGTCWIGAFDLQVLKNALGMDEKEEIFAFTPLGYPTKDFTPVPKTASRSAK